MAYALEWRTRREAERGRDRRIHLFDLPHWFRARSPWSSARSVRPTTRTILADRAPVCGQAAATRSRGGSLSWRNISRPWAGQRCAAGRPFAWPLGTILSSPALTLAGAHLVLAKDCGSHAEGASSAPVERGGGGAQLANFPYFHPDRPKDIKLAPRWPTEPGGHWAPARLAVPNRAARRTPFTLGDAAPPLILAFACRWAAP